MISAIGKMSSHLLDYNPEALVEELKESNKSGNINTITDRLSEMQDDGVLDEFCMKFEMDCDDLLKYVGKKLLVTPTLEVLELSTLEDDELLERLEKSL